MNRLPLAVQLLLETDGVTCFFASRAKIARSLLVNQYIFDLVGIYLRHPRSYTIGHDRQGGFANFLRLIAVRDDGLVVRVTRPSHWSSPGRTSKHISRALTVLTDIGLSLIEILSPTGRPCTIFKSGKGNTTGENVIGTRLMLDHTCTCERYKL